MSNRDGIDALAKKSEIENNYIQYQSKIFPKLSAEDMLKNNVHFVTLKAVSVTIRPFLKWFSDSSLQYDQLNFQNKYDPALNENENVFFFKESINYVQM